MSEKSLNIVYLTGSRYNFPHNNRRADQRKGVAKRDTFGDVTKRYTLVNSRSRWKQKGGARMLYGTIMTAVGSSILCHQRINRRGAELTQARAKLILFGVCLVFSGVLTCMFE